MCCVVLSFCTYNLQYGTDLSMGLEFPTSWKNNILIIATGPVCLGGEYHFHTASIVFVILYFSLLVLVLSVSQVYRGCCNQDLWRL